MVYSLRRPRVPSVAGTNPLRRIEGSLVAGTKPLRGLVWILQEITDGIYV